MRPDDRTDELARDAEMERLSVGERAALAALGVLALAALGMLTWQRRPIALVVSAVPSDVEGRPRPPLVMAGAAVWTAPAAAPALAPPVRWDAALEAARQVDVNTADAAELERLPGVGPALAKRIVEERSRRGPFRSAEDLARVRGIGPRTVESVKDYVKVED